MYQRYVSWNKGKHLFLVQLKNTFRAQTNPLKTLQITVQGSSENLFQWLDWFDQGL